MPKEQKVSIKAWMPGSIENFRPCTWTEVRELSTGDILRLLARYGLGLHELKLVYYRAIREMPFKDIVVKQNWLNSNSAEYHYKRALKKLRVGGFKIK